MKKILFVLTVFVSGLNFAQSNEDSVDMIIDTYLENIGGKEAWSAVTGIKMSGSISQGGMDIPFDIYNMADGRTAWVISVQGMVIKQNVYDGEVLWATNFMSQKAEKSDDEATENAKRASKAGIDPYLNYKEKGFVITLEGKESVEGVECYKLKVNKGKMLADGEEVDDISFSFFDAESFVPIQVEQEVQAGDQKGEIMITAFSDYDEVDGVFIPFSMTMKQKGGMSQTIEFDEIIVNPEVEADLFSFPAE